MSNRRAKESLFSKFDDFLAGICEFFTHSSDCYPRRLEDVLERRLRYVQSNKVSSTRRSAKALVVRRKATQRLPVNNAKRIKKDDRHTRRELAQVTCDLDNSLAVLRGHYESTKELHNQGEDPTASLEERNETTEPSEEVEVIADPVGGREDMIELDNEREDTATSIEECEATADILGNTAVSSKPDEILLGELIEECEGSAENSTRECNDTTHPPDDTALSSERYQMHSGESVKASEDFSGETREFENHTGDLVGSGEDYSGDLIERREGSDSDSDSRPPGAKHAAQRDANQASQHVFEEPYPRSLLEVEDRQSREDLPQCDELDQDNIGKFIGKIGSSSALIHLKHALNEDYQIAPLKDPLTIFKNAQASYQNWTQGITRYRLYALDFLESLESLRPKLQKIKRKRKYGLRALRRANHPMKQMAALNKLQELQTSEQKFIEPQFMNHWGIFEALKKTFGSRHNLAEEDVNRLVSVGFLCRKLEEVVTRLSCLWPSEDHGFAQQLQRSDAWQEQFKNILRELKPGLYLTPVTDALEEVARILQKSSHARLNLQDMDDKAITEYATRDPHLKDLAAVLSVGPCSDGQAHSTAQKCCEVAVTTDTDVHMQLDVEPEIDFATSQSKSMDSMETLTLQGSIDTESLDLASGIPTLFEAQQQPSFSSFENLASFPDPDREMHSYGADRIPEYIFATPLITEPVCDPLPYLPIDVPHIAPTNDGSSDNYGEGIVNVSDYDLFSVNSSNPTHPYSYDQLGVDSFVNQLVFSSSPSTY